VLVRVVTAVSTCSECSCVVLGDWS